MHSNFIRSRYCENGGCVEVAFMGDTVKVRDKEGNILTLSASSWASFLRTVV